MHVQKMEPPSLQECVIVVIDAIQLLMHLSNVQLALQIIVKVKVQQVNAQNVQKDISIH